MRSLFFFLFYLGSSLLGYRVCLSLVGFGRCMLDLFAAFIRLSVGFFFSGIGPLGGISLGGRLFLVKLFCLLAQFFSLLFRLLAQLFFFRFALFFGRSFTRFGVFIISAVKPFASTGNRSQYSSSVPGESIHVSSLGPLRSGDQINSRLRPFALSGLQGAAAIPGHLSHFIDDIISKISTVLKRFSDVVNAVFAGKSFRFKIGFIDRVVVGAQPFPEHGRLRDFALRQRNHFLQRPAHQFGGTVDCGSQISDLKLSPSLAVVIPAVFIFNILCDVYIRLTALTGAGLCTAGFVHRLYPAQNRISRDLELGSCLCRRHITYLPLPAYRLHSLNSALRHNTGRHINLHPDARRYHTEHISARPEFTVAHFKSCCITNMWGSVFNVHRCRQRGAGHCDIAVSNSDIPTVGQCVATPILDRAVHAVPHFRSGNSPLHDLLISLPARLQLPCEQFRGNRPDHLQKYRFRCQPQSFQIHPHTPFMQKSRDVMPRP